MSDNVQLILSQLPRINRSTLRGMLWLMQNKRFIGNLLPNNAVIVEAGAHKGEDTADMARRWPDATIHAIEPVPELYLTLTTKTSEYKNVKRYNVALSDKNWIATLHISQGTSDGSSSLLRPKEHLNIHPTVTFPKTVRVKTVTLDTWAKRHRIPFVDFFWFDLQGMEFRVLQKSHVIFPKVKLLYTEINLKENYNGVPLYPQYKKWLIAHGMAPLRENIYWKDMGNALFIRKTLYRNQR